MKTKLEESREDIPEPRLQKSSTPNSEPSQDIVSWGQFGEEKNLMLQPMILNNKHALMPGKSYTIN